MVRVEVFVQHGASHKIASLPFALWIQGNNVHDAWEMGLTPPPRLLLQVHRPSDGSRPAPGLRPHADPGGLPLSCLSGNHLWLLALWQCHGIWGHVDTRSFQASGPSAWGGLPALRGSSTNASLHSVWGPPVAWTSREGAPAHTGVGAASQFRGGSWAALKLAFNSPDWLDEWGLLGIFQAASVNLQKTNLIDGIILPNCLCYDIGALLYFKFLYHWVWGAWNHSVPRVPPRTRCVVDSADQDLQTLNSSLKLFAGSCSQSQVKGHLRENKVISCPSETRPLVVCPSRPRALSDLRAFVSPALSSLGRWASNTHSVSTRTGIHTATLQAGSCEGTAQVAIYHSSQCMNSLLWNALSPKTEIASLLEKHPWLDPWKFN